MVKLSPSIFLGILSLHSLCAVALPSPFVAHPRTTRTIDGLTKALTLILQQLKVMTNDLNAFPQTGGTLGQALVIRNDAARVSNTLATAAQEAGGTTVSDKDAVGILNIIRALDPVVATALHATVEKKSAFAGLPFGNIVTALVRQAISNLDAGTQRLGNVLIPQLPKDNVPEATFFFNKVHGEFAAAEAAYANA